MTAVILVAVVAGAVALGGCRLYQPTDDLGSDEPMADTEGRADVADAVDARDSAVDAADTTGADSRDGETDGGEQTDAADGGDGAETDVPLNCSEMSMERCGNQCVALSSDYEHCGRCNNECGAGETCHESTCKPCEDETACPFKSEVTECRSHVCRALACIGKRHPCEDGTKCCEWTPRQDLVLLGEEGNFAAFDLDYDSQGGAHIVYVEDPGDGSATVNGYLGPDGNGGFRTETFSNIEVPPVGGSVRIGVDGNGWTNATFLRGSSDGGYDLQRAERMGKDSWSVSRLSKGVAASQTAVSVESPNQQLHVLFRREDNQSSSYLHETSKVSTGNKNFFIGSNRPSGESVEFDGMDRWVLIQTTIHPEELLLYFYDASKDTWLEKEALEADAEVADLEVNEQGRPMVAYLEEDVVHFAEFDRKRGSPQAGGWTEPERLLEQVRHLGFEYDGEGQPRIYAWQLDKDASNPAEKLLEVRRSKGTWNAANPKTLVKDESVSRRERLAVGRDDAGAIGVLYSKNGTLNLYEW